MGNVEGHVKRVLRAEGLVILLVCLYLYSLSGYSWLTFLLLFFCPDLTFFAYLINSKVGAIFYNLAHSYAVVALVVVAYLLFGIDTLKLVSIVWVAHIGFDRALGYGLKYSKGFTYTHLGKVGNEQR